MIRYLVGSLALVLFLGIGLQAEEIRGKVKSVDKDKTHITLIVADKERTLDLAKDVKVFGTFAQRLRKTTTLEIANGITTLQPNTAVIATTEKRDNRDLVTQIRIEGTQGTVRKSLR